MNASGRGFGGAGRLAMLRRLGLLGGLSGPLFDRLAASALAALGACGARISLDEGAGAAILGSVGAGLPASAEPGTALELPLLGGDGERVGAFTVVSSAPRQWSERDVATLRELSHAAADALALCLENVLLGAVKESSLDGVLAVTADRQVLGYNRRFAELWAIPDEVLATRSDEAMLSTALSLVDDQEGYLRRVADLYSSGSAESDEILLNDGRVLARYGVPLEGPSGAPLGRIWHFRDITRPKRAEWALAEGEERLRAFIESASDAAFTMDESSVITYANPSVDRIFGYQPSELVGMPLSTLVPEGPREKQPLGADGELGAGVRRIPWGAMELLGLHRDGREIPLEVSFGRFSSAGRTFFTALARDVTERRQVDRVIRDAAISYRTLFDSLEELVCIVDLDGHLLSVNEAVIHRYGFAREEVLGATPALLTATDLCPDPEIALRRMRDESPAEPIRLEWWGRTKEGEVFPMEVVLTRGEYFGAPVVIAVGRDITERKRSEEALRESEELFRQIAENIREDFWIYDATFENAIYVSPAHEEVWGFPLGTARSDARSFLRLVLPEDLPALTAAMERVTQGEPVRIEYRIRRDDGALRWVWSRAFPVLDEEGRVYRVVGTTEDVTERKEAEQELRWMGTVVESSLDAIVSSTHEGEITSWNPAAERIFGYSAEEVIGRDWAFLIPPDHLATYRRVRRKIASGGVPSRYEAQRLRKDGARIDVAITPFALYDHQGRVVGAAAILRDITESKAREEQRRLLAAALERLEEGVTLATFDGEIIYANENHGRILGYDPEQRPRPSYTEFLPDEQSAEEQKQILRTVIEEGGWAGRVRRRRLDNGQVLPVELIMGRLDRDGDAQSLLFGIVRDITEEIEQERYLRRAERLASVGTLVGGVAHELNNPLHAIRSFADLLLMDQRSAEDREALEIVKRESDRAAKIVSDLRLFARQTQDEQSERKAVDLNDVVRHVAKVRRYALETRNVTIVEELETDLPPVLANRGELEQVVLNLVVNAEQAMDGSQWHRRLRLRTSTGAAGVLLRVSDTGPGIAPEHRDRIFDPFFTTKSPGEGTGLGLSVVHSIVSEHGGQIRVESDSEGTSFVIELPVAGPADRPFVDEPERLPAGRAELRVLVVEDEDAVRSATVRYLRRVGYRVDGAADGSEALNMLDAVEYDAIVSDLRMPGLDGEALLRELRRRGGGLDRRLIFVTGDASGVRGAPLLAGASVPVLLKPVRLEEVARLVGRLASSPPEPSRSANGG